jgi:hypothetical protein
MTWTMFGLLAVSGCDGRAVGDDQRGAEGNKPTAAQPTDPTPTNNPNPEKTPEREPLPDPDPEPVPADDCLLAIRVDECCQPAMPATRQQVAADPCLVPYPPRDRDTQHCPDLMLEICDCSWRAIRPTSYLVELASDGQCYFVGECETAADCTVARDFTLSCCACPSVFPRPYVAQQACVVGGPAEDPGDDCMEICPDSCGECGPSPVDSDGEYECVHEEDGLNTCQACLDCD